MYNVGEVFVDVLEGCSDVVMIVIENFIEGGVLMM